MSDENLSDEAKRAIGEAIDNYMTLNDFSRKQLVRHDLSEDKIQRALHGDFTYRTLLKIENYLGRSFHDEKTDPDRALEMIGGYSRNSVENLIGQYILIRPSFTNPSKINAYKIDVDWVNEKGGLFFQESMRADAKYTQTGYICIPPSKPFIYFSTIANGSVRNIVLNYFDTEGIARGVISTIYNPKGPHFLPICAPVVVLKKPKIDSAHLGIVDVAHEKYNEYLSLLSLVAEDYAMMITGPTLIDRRKGLSIVS